MKDSDKRTLLYTFLGLYLLSGLVTLLGITKQIDIDPFYLKTLFSASLCETIFAVIILFKASFLKKDTPEPPNPIPTTPFPLPDLDRDWILCFIGQSQGDILNDLYNGLKRNFSETGEGKEISSTLAYWGIVPAWKWTQACKDSSYQVMKSGSNHLSSISKKLQYQISTPMHLVSLGIGDGKLDSIILSELQKPDRGLCYFPVDFSPEMLRIGIEDSTKNLERSGKIKTVPIQIDFSLQINLSKLKTMINKFIDNDPVLYCLLGNTLANFKNDLVVLQNIADLLCKDDYLLIGLSYSDQVTDEIANLAASEYSNSEPFKNFLTSALLQNTDLPLANFDLVFEGKADNVNESIFIKMFARNKKNKDMEYRLGSDEKVIFKPQETIRLYTSRKYSRNAINKMMNQVGLNIIWQNYLSYGPESPFGSCILLVKKQIS